MYDYKELVFNLMFLAKYCHSEYNDLCVDDELKKAADAIEQLVKERDAAVDEIEHDCFHCKRSVLYRHLGTYYNDCELCRTGHCKGRDKWEWRGVQEDNDENC